MKVLLADSADTGDIASIAGLGLVDGVTTNPTLMRAVTGDPLAQFASILNLGLAANYYQPTGAYGDDLSVEARRAFDLAPERATIKVMATPAGVALAAELRSHDVAVALTAAQDAGAMVAGIALGCAAVIPYHDRGLRDPAVSVSLIDDLHAVRGARTDPVILAASVKNGAQVVQAFRLGADAVSAAPAALRDLVEHPSSLAAERRFAAEYGSYDELAGRVGTR